MLVSCCENSSRVVTPHPKRGTAASLLPAQCEALSPHTPRTPQARGAVLERDVCPGVYCVICSFVHQISCFSLGSGFIVGLMKIII